MKIASLSPATTEILFQFGLEESIVCTDQFSNFPEEARDIPHLRDHQKVDIEELQSYEPDLVFTATPVQEKLSQLLKQHDIPVVHHDPRTINAIYEMIRNLGMLLESTERPYVGAKADELVLAMQQGLNDVKRRAGMLYEGSERSEKSERSEGSLRVYIEEWHDSPFASGNWVPEVASVAGLDPFPIAAGELSAEVTLDQVAAFDPDMIVISWCGAGSLADKGLLVDRLGWDQLRAVQLDSIRVIDDSLLNRPGPRLVEGAQRLFGWAFEMLH